MMKKISYVWGALILTFIIFANANAFEYQPGPYLGGQFGWGQLDERDGYRKYIGANEVGTFISTGWRAYAGYSFNPILSIESENGITTKNLLPNCKLFTLGLSYKITGVF